MYMNTALCSRVLASEAGQKQAEFDLLSWALSYVQPPMRHITYSHSYSLINKLSTHFFYIHILLLCIMSWNITAKELRVIH